jgi:hypothetical protein
MPAAEIGKRPSAQYPKVLAVRLPWESFQKLRQLCRKTHRQRADVIRMLLAQAVLSGFPDVILVSDPSDKPEGVDKTHACSAGCRHE